MAPAPGLPGVRRRAAVVAGVTAALAVAASAARAGQLDVVQASRYDPSYGYVVEYAAFSGETNRVSVSYSGETRTLRLHDAGVAAIVPAPPADVPDPSHLALPPRLTNCL